MSARARVLLIHQRLTLPWIFDSAEHAEIDLVLVPRADERIDPAQLPPAVHELLWLDVDDDPAGTLDVLRSRHATAPFDGVCTLYEPSVPFAAAAARELGLPGLSPEVAERVRDKRVMRERLRRAGLNTPRFAALDGPEDWERALGVPLPAVVKPSDGFSSAGVTRVDNAEFLPAVVNQVWLVSGVLIGRQAGDGNAPGLIVEEFIDGPEFAVEALAHQGDVRILSIGYKGEPAGPHFEEGVYRAPAVLSPAAREAIVREVTLAHEALGVSDGPTHTELRLRGGEHPYILEVGARIGGSGVSHYVVHATTGIDFAAEAMRIALGRPPRCFAADIETRGAAGNYIVPCRGSGRILAIEGLDEVAAAPEVDTLTQMLYPGDIVRPYPEFSGYPAFVLSRHPTVEDAERFHESLATRITITYEPADRQPTSEATP